MKHTKAIKLSHVKEPEVEYLKEISKKIPGKRLRKQTTHPKRTKDITDDNPKLLTNDDPFMLDEIFGICKKRKINLDKLREKQWGKRG